LNSTIIIPHHPPVLSHLRYKYAPEFSPKKWVLQELVPGNVEFSVSLLVSYGSIMDMVGMRYTYVPWHATVV